MREDVKSLNLRLAISSTAACTCQTKTPAIEYHLPMCKYRLLWESMARIDELEAALRFYRDGFVLQPQRTALGIDLSEWKPTEALLDDCGSTASEALAAKPIPYEGWTCPECGPVMPPEVTHDERHDREAGGCGLEVH